MRGFDPEKVKVILQEVAAEHILPFFRNLKAEDIAFKKADDPVTIADQRAESALSTRLLDLLKGSEVVGEEAFASNLGVLESLFGESPVWIIDPIDGTRNFVGGSPEFGVIVALAERNQVIAGWIYDPTSNEVLTAERGSGAFYKDHKLKVLPAAVLGDMRGCLSDMMASAHEKTKPHKSIQPVIEIMTSGAHEYPRMVLNQPHFGKDKPQLHFRATLRQTYPWDDAAGVLIHNEAGGYAANWLDEPYVPSVIDRGLLIAPDPDSWHVVRDWCRTFSDIG